MKTFKTTAGQTAKKLAIVIIACGLFFASCTKEGPTGPQGSAGANGTNGNANVQVFNATAAPSNWTADAQSGWYTSFNMTVDPTQGAVTIFWSSDNVNWTGLPFVASTTSQPNINFKFNSTSINFYYDPAVGVLSIAQPSTNQYFKIVVIPPAMVKPNINPHNYNEVKVAYNL